MVSQGLVVVNATSFYAISNHTIARYDKQTGKCLVRWEAPANSGIQHLNSGVVVDGRLYCANLNWPLKPLKNTLEIFDAEALSHLQSKPFSETQGAINWILTGSIDITERGGSYLHSIVMPKFAAPNWFAMMTIGTKRESGRSPKRSCNVFCPIVIPVARLAPRAGFS